MANVGINVLSVVNLLKQAYDTEFEKGFNIVDKSKRLYQHECGCVIQMS